MHAKRNTYFPCNKKNAFAQVAFSIYYIFFK